MGEGPERMMGRAVQLGASVDALAALAAHVRIETEGLPADPAVRELLASIAAELLGPGATVGATAGAGAGGTAGAGTASALGPVVGLARTFVRQAAELIDNPGRSGGWDQVDVPLLQSVGRMSMGIVDAFSAAERVLGGLAEALARAGGSLLDVGTGAGWLAIAVARSHPELSVVGIDIFGPALELAKANVEEQGLADRIELRLQDATTLVEPGRYDVVWLPLPFLPKAVVEPAMAAAIRALKPGGWLLPGTFAGPSGRLAELLTDLRTVRAGGHPWTAEELHAAMRAAGLTDVQQLPRTWAAPVHLHAGRTAA